MKLHNFAEGIIGPLFFYPHRGGDEKKDKSGEKTPENQNSGEHDAVVKASKHLEMNHGTAV